MSSFEDYIRITRPNICVLAWFAFLIGAFIIGLNIFSLIFILSSISVLMICAGGNIINDYFDYEIDKINKPKRPLPSGRIYLKNVLIFYLIVNIFALIVAYLVNIYFFTLVIVNILTAFIYSYKLKRMLLIGNIIDSYLASVCFVAPILIYNSFTFIVNSPLFILGLIAFFGNFSREIIKDIEDVKGDKDLGAYTLPIAFGKDNAWLIAKILILIALILGVLPYYYDYVSVLYFAGYIPAIILCISSFNKDAAKSQKRIKKAMFALLIGFLIGL
ncbi:MAG: geranylgeranylglycerol-phosphate geranylgeranyltransferase [Candidatus Aenigmarchaeota archaeon ex4484_56]|nr:MAG: geranylgeranylglycerol-phosphate geranylgeranyltransferase [Candidatus Aenigmarchaeota archaeon ex4484_56]